MPAISSYRGIVPAIACPFTADHRIDDPGIDAGDDAELCSLRKSRRLRRLRGFGRLGWFRELRRRRDPCGGEYPGDLAGRQ